jgi:hypothetical protein
VYRFITIFFVLSFSCKAQTTLYQEVKTSKAMVMTGIPMSADGCGNTVKIDSSYFHATNLPFEFIKDSLWVEISYKLTDTIYCGRGRYPMPAVDILQISKVQ